MFPNQPGRFPPVHSLHPTLTLGNGDSHQSDQKIQIQKNESVEENGARPARPVGVERRGGHEQPGAEQQGKDQDCPPNHLIEIPLSDEYIQSL